MFVTDVAEVFVADVVVAEVFVVVVVVVAPVRVHAYGCTLVNIYVCFLVAT